MGCFTSKRCKPTRDDPEAPLRVTSQKSPQPVVESQMRSAQRSDIKSGANAVTSPGHRGDALRERPRQVVKSPTPLSQKSDIKSVGNGHSVTLREQPQTIEKESTPSSQKSYINSVENAGGSSGHRKEASQEPPRPVAVSRMRSSRRGDINSRGDAAEATPQERPQPAVRSSPTPSSQQSDIKSVGNASGSSGHRREVTLQEQFQPVVVTRIRSSQRSVINSEGDTGGSSAHRGEETPQERPQPLVSRIRSQRSDIKTEGNTVASSGHRGEGALQERPQPAEKPPTPSSQKSDTKSVGNGHGGEEASQEQPRPVVESPILSSQNSYLNTGGNAGGSSEHRVTLQGQPRPVAISRIRSSQRSDTSSGGDAGGNSGHRGEVTLQERFQPVVVSRIRSSQRSVINSGGDAGGSSGHRGEEALQEQTRPVAESPIPLSQKSYLYSAGNAGGTRVTLQEQPRPVAVSRIRSSQRSDTNSGGGAGGSSGHRGEEALQEQLEPVMEPSTPSSQNSDINFGEMADARSGNREHKREHTYSPNTTNPTGGTGTLPSELRRVLPEHFKFRILVVGKIGSGKSSLIKAVFKVDMTAAPEITDINVNFHPEDNYYLIVHEFSGLESQADGPRNLKTILDFISSRTRSSLEASKKLHAVWICVPASDVISGRLGDGVKQILGITTVPVVLVVTKFDEIVTKVLRDRHGGDSQYHARARARAQKMYEDSCRRLFDKAPIEVPTGVVSANSSFVDLIDNLIDMTDRFITNARVPSAQSGGVQEAMQRAQPVPLAWSAALRVSHELIIQTTIAIGRRRYWRTLWNNRDFAGQKLKDCVNIIHFDIVEIWNLNDETGYLSSDRFKIKMSHLVRDLSASFKSNKKKKRAGSANAVSRSGTAGAGDEFADWVDFDYQGSRENVCCMMGYIVDLTVILDDIFRAVAGNIMSQDCAESILGRFRTGRRHQIHKYIRNNVKETYSLRLTAHKDIFLESVDDLIKQHCVPPSESGSRQDSEFSGASRSVQT